MSPNVTTIRAKLFTLIWWLFQFFQINADKSDITPFLTFSNPYVFNVLPEFQSNVVHEPLSNGFQYSKLMPEKVLGKEFRTMQPLEEADPRTVSRFAIRNLNSSKKPKLNEGRFEKISYMDIGTIMLDYLGHRLSSKNDLHSSEESASYSRHENSKKRGYFLYPERVEDSQPEPSTNPEHPEPIEEMAYPESLRQHIPDENYFHTKSDEEEHTIKMRKRTNCCIIGHEIGDVGLCLPCDRNNQLDGKKVTGEFINSYVSVPIELVNLTSIIVNPNSVCENLEIPKSKINLQDYPRIKPVWIQHVQPLGLCPYVLTKRLLGPNVFPSQIVELECLCEDSVCSKYGGLYRCISIKQNVLTWVSSSQKGQYSRDIQEMTVGCVCAQEPAKYADNGNKYFVGEV